MATNTNNYLRDVGNLGLGEEPRIVVQYLSARNIQVGRTPAMSSFVALALFFLRWPLMSEGARLKLPLSTSTKATVKVQESCNLL